MSEEDKNRQNAYHAQGKDRRRNHQNERHERRLAKTDRRKVPQDLLQFDLISSIAYNHFLRAALDQAAAHHAGPNEQKIDFDGTSRLALTSTRVFMRNRRDFVKDYGDDEE